METLREFQYITMHGLKYNVVGGLGDYFLANNTENSKIFELLKIENKIEFITNIVGYKPVEGRFPYLRTLEDLTKVAEALINYNNNSDEVEVYTNF